MSVNNNSETTILEVHGLTKAFYGNIVLDHVDFHLSYGEVLGLVGENGAGKSTLVKILTGAYQPDGGTILIDGKEVVIPDIRTANSLGISEVFQELSLANNMTVADNIFIGSIPTNMLGLIDQKRFHQQAAKLIGRFGVDIKPDDLVQNLSIGKRQIVEILKAISKEPKILILDEPTSSLEEDEIQILFSFINELRKNNYSIIYISHHMSEIFSIVDRVMVLRDGKKVGVYQRNDLDMEQLIHLMINQDYRAFFGNSETRKLSSETILEVKGLTREPFFKDINFTLNKGEILGIAGIIGSGKSELCQSLYGVGKTSIGEVNLSGKKVNLKAPSEVKNQGILLLPENRKTQGLFLNDQVGKNLIACVIPLVSNFGFISTRKMKDLAKDYVKRLNIKLRSIEQIVRFLSGGNQQKVLVAKSIAHGPKVFIAMDPTRGIDVGAKADIHRILHELTNSGMSIIMISSELDELTNMCDRIVVMNFGGINAIFRREEFNTERILFAMHQSAAQGA